MKIDRNVEAERISAIEATREAPEASDTENVAGSHTTPLLNLSSGAQKVQKLRDAVEQSPSVRSEKVEKLKKQMQEGTLKMDTQTLARILEKLL